MSMILSDEANERLQALWRMKLAKAESTLAEVVASPIPADEHQARRRVMAITRWSNRVRELRRQIAQ